MYADPPADAVAAMTSNAGCSPRATSSAIRRTSAKSNINRRSFPAGQHGDISVTYRLTHAFTRPLDTTIVSRPLPDGTRSIRRVVARDCHVTQQKLVRSSEADPVHELQSRQRADPLLRILTHSRADRE